MGNINKNPGTRIICAWCGNMIIGRRKQFCSRSCQRSYMKIPENNNFYKHKHTKENLEIMSTKKKGDNNPMYGETPWNKGVPRSKETKLKMSESTQKYYDDYEFDPTKLTPGNYHDDAILAYGYQCCICGLDDTSKLLEVHHIDGDHCNDDLSNLVVLCTACHFDAHRDPLTGRRMHGINKEFQSKIYESREV